MLNNSEISDMIPRPKDDEQEPDEGWDCIKGSVLKYSGKIFKFKVVIWAEHNICNGLANKGDLKRDSEEIVAEYFNNLKQYTQPSTSVFIF